MSPAKQSNNARPTCKLVAVSLAAVASAICPLITLSPKLLLWNASASVPVGLYIVLPNAKLHVGDLAVTDLPPDIRSLAAQRQYLPPGVLLIKPVSALSGADVCRRNADIDVNGRWTATAKITDRKHRPMPVWSGCRHLSPQDVFLMNPEVHDSFDGRYFGPITLRFVRGRAFPLLTFGPRKQPS
ncbi:S26 family signal peptidase [Asticcacaulis benevestitus]|uniref:S26 family signal peptidase n=1 Tax=Asticcacaulis benevestitus TaxID=347481 RepID=UPI0009DB0B4F